MAMGTGFMKVIPALVSKYSFGGAKNKLMSVQIVLNSVTSTAANERTHEDMSTVLSASLCYSILYMPCVSAMK